MKERGRAISNLLYPDPVLSRSCRNTPPNHNHQLKSSKHKHNQPKTIVQAYIHPTSHTSSNTSGYRSGWRCWCRLLGGSGSVDIDMASTASLTLRRSGSRSTSGRRGPLRSGSKSRSRSNSKSRHRPQVEGKRPSPSRSGGWRVDSSTNSKADLSKVRSIFYFLRQTSLLTFICIAVRLAFGAKALCLYLGVSIRLCRSHPIHTLAKEDQNPTLALGLPISNRPHKGLCRTIHHLGRLLLELVGQTPVAPTQSQVQVAIV